MYAPNIIIACSASTGLLGANMWIKALNTDFAFICFIGILALFCLFGLTYLIIAGIHELPGKRRHELPVPGRKGPTCLVRKRTTWVVQGKYCPVLNAAYWRISSPHLNLSYLGEKDMHFNFVEFDDGSDWTLNKCLTHANHTSFYTLYKMMWCKGEYKTIWLP